MSRRVLVIASTGLLALLVGLGSTAWPERKASLHYDEANFSQPTFRVRMEHNLRVPMRDGVELSADIYRPDAEGRFPAILVRTPYNNSRPHNVARARFYAERGYAVVLQDTRGRYDSEGKFYPFRHEPSDGYDTDEWIGQQPWSNGKIGTVGGSYVGFTQLSQAIRGSPYLTAMVPRVTTLDTYASWIYTGGAFQYAFALSWGATVMDGRSPGEEPV